MSKREWVAAAGTAWLLLAVYVGTMLVLIRRYQPKVATEGLDIAERDAKRQVERAMKGRRL